MEIPTAHVSGERVVTIPTNKGNLIFSAFEIDQEIVSGQNMNIADICVDGSMWTPYRTPRSLVARQGVITEFISSKGNVQLTSVGSGFRFSVNISGQSQPFRFDVNSLPANRPYAFHYCFLIGSNGVPYVLSGAVLSDVGLGSASYYVPNTIDAFGLYENDTFHPTAFLGFDEAAIKLAEALLEESVPQKIDISTGTLILSPTEFYYDGSEHLPTVRVYDADGNELYYGTDFGVSFSPDRTNPGQKIALAYGEGNYTGELTAFWWIREGDSHPYSPGGESLPSTGPTDGTWELPSDEIAPTGSIFSDLDARLYRPYAMTAAQVASFSNQLWNTSILDVISRYFEKPTDVVISLMSYPFEIQSTETASQVNFNWLTEWSSVYVTGHTITQELQTLDFGYIDLERYSGTFYDYQPYSSVQLYLPYIGFVPLKINEVLGRRIYLKYIVDVITGDFSAIIETSWPDQSHEDETTIPVIATYQGNLAKALPLSQQDMFSIYKTGAELALAGATVAAAGIEGFAAVGEAGEAEVAAESYEAMGESRLAAQSERRANVAANHVRTARRKAASAGVNAMYAVGSANLPIIRNGNIDGISGRTSMQEAFVIISVPDQNIPSNQGILGYPTNLPGPLSNYAGYTEVRDIRVKSSTATEAELAEIEQIVRGGIII